MRWTTGLIGCAALGLAAMPAAAQKTKGKEAHSSAPAAQPIMDDTIPTADALDEFAARIPDHDWYPDGYYDIRVAAAADYAAAEEARVANFVATSGETASAYYGDGSDDRLNLGDCDIEDMGDEDETDPAYLSLAWLAKDMEQFRVRLERAGFPSELINQPLLDFERWRIAQILVTASGRDWDSVDFEKEFGVVGYDPDSYPLGVLLDRLNAARTGNNAGLPEVILADGCGGEGETVIFRASPGNAQIWLISAFGFRVCTRRNPDPWDKYACRWNEYEQGAENSLGGRYVYEVRWSDGTVRRGTREIRPDYSGNGPVTVTFRKTGS